MIFQTYGNEFQGLLHLAFKTALLENVYNIQICGF